MTSRQSPRSGTASRNDSSASSIAGGAHAEMGIGHDDERMAQHGAKDGPLRPAGQPTARCVDVQSPRRASPTPRGRHDGSDRHRNPGPGELLRDRPDGRRLPRAVSRLARRRAHGAPARLRGELSRPRGRGASAGRERGGHPLPAAGSLRRPGPGPLLGPGGRHRGGSSSAMPSTMRRMAACWPRRRWRCSRSTPRWRSRRLARRTFDAVLHPVAGSGQTLGSLSGSPGTRSDIDTIRYDPGPSSSAGPLALVRSAPAAARSRARLAAQEQTVVEQLAPVLAAEDARDFQPTCSGARWWRRTRSCAGSAPRPPAGSAISARPRSSLPLLADPDSTVRLAAAFALGLLRDTAAVQPLIDRLTGLPALDASTAAEAVTALAKIGGRRSGDFFSGVLGGRLPLSQDDRQPAFHQILAEAWRLGPGRPGDRYCCRSWTIRALGPRLRAVYSLRSPEGARRRQPPAPRPARPRRLHALAGGPRAHPELRGTARAGAVRRRRPAGPRAADDPSPPVRINAIRSLAGYGDSALARTLASMLDDPLPGIQVTAAETLGELGGAEAVRGLAKAATGKGDVSDSAGPRWFPSPGPIPTAFGTAAARWRASQDWRDRAAAARGHRHRGTGAVAGVPRRPGWEGGCRGPAGVERRGRRARTGAAGRCAAAASAPGRGGAERRGRHRRPRGGSGRPAGSHAACTARPGATRFPRRRSRRSTRILAIRKSSAAAQGRVDREFFGEQYPAGQLSAPALGRGQLARGGRPVGAGLSGRDRALAPGLSRRGRAAISRPRLRRTPARRDRDGSRAARSRSRCSDPTRR